MPGVSNNIRLVVFDFDGTLADSQSSILLCMDEAFAKAQMPQLSATQVRRVVGLSLHEAVQTLLGDRAEKKLVEAIVARYKLAFTELRTTPDYTEALFPGALECLGGLSQSHEFLGIATGKALRGLTASLTYHNLADIFVTLQTADHAPSKPHPAMLERAMAEVGVTSSQTVMIGDTVYDMEMAKNAGVSAIGVSWGYHDAHELQSAGAKGVVESFAHLPDFLLSMDRAL